MYGKYFILLALVIMAVFAASPVMAAIYYVSYDGNDLINDGLSQGAPWKTIAKVNSVNFQAGDTIKFRKGDTWRIPEDDQLKPDSGDATGDVTYTSYGTGDKPLFLGSVEKNDPGDWQETSSGSNIWYTTDSSFGAVAGQDVGSIIFNNEVSWGDWKLSQAELVEQGDFYYEESSSTLYLYSAGNPADPASVGYYSDIECAVDIKLIDIVGKSYVTISNLDLRYSSAHAIWVRDGSNNIIVENNDISYIGGALQGTAADSPRYGNGIEIWGNADNITVEYCNITQIYDAGLTNQSPEKDSTGTPTDFDQTYITYRYNNVTYSKMGIEIWSQNAGTLSNIKVLNNTFSQMGYGWSETSDNIFFGSPFYAPNATVNNIVITDNIFDGAAGGYLEAVVMIGGGNYKFERNIVRNGATGVEGVWIKRQPWQTPGNNLPQCRI